MARHRPISEDLVAQADLEALGGEVTVGADRAATVILWAPWIDLDDSRPSRSRDSRMWTLASTSARAVTTCAECARSARSSAAAWPSLSSAALVRPAAFANAARSAV